MVDFPLIGFFFWKMLVQQLEVYRSPVVLRGFPDEIAFLSLAKINEILTVTKMACVAVQHPSSINHHHPMILLDGLGRK